MFEISFAAAELTVAVIWLAVRVAVWIRQKRIDWKREALLFLLYFDLAVIIRFVFFPMERIDGKIQPLVFNYATAYPFRINLIPYIHLFQFGSQHDLLLNVLGNFCLFIPTGIILPILFKRLNRFWKVVLTGALLSLTIEIIQLPFAVRASDIDDLLLNTAGVAAGYGIYALVRLIKNSIKHGKSKPAQKPQ